MQTFFCAWPPHRHTTLECQNLLYACIWAYLHQQIWPSKKQSLKRMHTIYSTQDITQFSINVESSYSNFLCR